ncbi:MAG: hypothetical protein ACRD2L_13135 [Terriglobia bacterium]
MNERFAVIEGVVGSDALGLSVHRHSDDGRHLACIGLRDDSRLIWQEIEMSQEQVGQFERVLVSGNTVRVSGLLKKQLGLPVCRVQVEGIQLIRATEPVALRMAA